MRLIQVITIALFFVESGSAQLSEAYTDLKFSYAEALMEIEGPVEALKDAYAKRLKEMASEAQESGDLRRAILIRKELESFRTVLHRAEDQRLREVQSTYENRLHDLETTEQAKRKSLHEKYLKALEQMVSRETQAGNLDTALLAQKEIERIKEIQVGESHKGRAAPVVNFVADKNCVAEKAEDGVILTGLKKDGVFYNSSEKFSPPFIATVTAKTDSTNIRVRYGKGQIILNWEVNQDELRVRHPETGKKTGIKNEGRVPTDEWVELRWEIGKTNMKVIVDGDEKYEADGNFGDLKSSIGVGPAFGSTVTLKSLTVEQP